MIDEPILRRSYQAKEARQSVERSGFDSFREKFLKLRLAVKRLQVGINLNEDIPSVSVLDRQLQLLDSLMVPMV